MSYFEYKSHKIFYEVMGSGHPLLLLHGNTASSRMFMNLVNEYAKHYQIIVIDFLGNGQSERLATWSDDLWFDEAQQVITLLEVLKLEKVNLIGTSGGALAAINVALERPDLIAKVIADSFEGEKADLRGIKSFVKGREMSKNDPQSVAFYKWMQGDDWEAVIDADTQTIVNHAETNGQYFHHSLSNFKPEILFTGSHEDPLFQAGHYDALFDGLIKIIGHGDKHVFDHGGHPAMISNRDKFIEVSLAFLG